MRLPLTLALQNTLQFKHLFGMLQRHIVALIRAGRHVVELRRGRVARFNLRPPRNHFRPVVGLNVAPMGRANREHMRARLTQHVAAADAVGAQEGGQIVAAVGRTALGERGADERLQRRGRFG